MWWVTEPGAIKTDFGGRSFDFMNDESLAEYQELIGNLFQAFEPLLENAADPEIVAEVIYTAATDGTDKLRYTAGMDAEEFMANREQSDDATFISGIKQMFGL